MLSGTLYMVREDRMIDGHDTLAICKVNLFMNYERQLYVQ